MGWVFKTSLYTLLEEKLAETPGLESFVLGHHAELFLKGEIPEAREVLRCLKTLYDRDPFIPMPKLPL